MVLPSNDFRIRAVDVRHILLSLMTRFAWVVMDWDDGLGLSLLRTSIVPSRMSRQNNDIVIAGYRGPSWSLLEQQADEDSGTSGPYSAIVRRARNGSSSDNGPHATDRFTALLNHSRFAVGVL